MIVFDATTLVSATFRRDGVPARAVRHALRSDRVAVSEAVLAELLDVLDRPRLARFVSGDADLLVLHPWRGVRVLRPAEYLAEAGGGE